MSALTQIAAAAAAAPAHCALALGEDEYSYAWLAQRIEALALALAALAAPGERCAVLCNRSPLAYVALPAVLAAGLVYVPLSPGDPAARQADKLRRARVQILVVERAMLGQVAAIIDAMPEPPLVCAFDSDAADVAATAQARALPARADADPAYLLFTSGSTGEPKGVAVTHGALAHYVTHMGALLALQLEDRCSQYFDPSFDLALHDVLLCWAAGATLVPMRHFKPNFTEEIREARINVWFSVPSCISFADQTGQLKAGRLPLLRLSLFCGEALMAQDARAWTRAAPAGRILNLYGPTEATIAISLHEAGQDLDDAAVVPIGLPFGDNAFYLLDPESGQLSDGAEGELALAGPQLASGYWDDAAMTAQRFPTLTGPDGAPLRLYRTGDRVRRSAGTVHFLGRLDNEIKINGYRINPLEVETALAATAAPAPAAVVVRKPGRFGAVELVGFVSGGAATPEELMRQCRAILPQYMWPAQIIAVDDFPRLPNGKIDRKALASAAAL